MEEKPDYSEENIISAQDTKESDTKSEYSKQISAKSLASNDVKQLKKKKKPYPIQLLKDYQIEDLKKAFVVFDVKNEGRMSVRDLKTAIRACGFEPKKDEMRKFLSEFDPNDEGYISLSDFITMFTMKLAERDPKEEMLRAFKFFDRENKGGISFEDLKNCAFEVGEMLHDEELQEMMDEADINGDGLVDQDEFVKIMTKTYFYT
ncbi:caltractin-like [Cimex lectularius]|uniref:EF-hand domain-containing protein n=1 Tax=Cimex lectularius TaxID=79782 RepID=A0A8I6TBG9_CIMLE|nr:caltractin-like [Cimex lectularius]